MATSRSAGTPDTGPWCAGLAARQVDRRMKAGQVIAIRATDRMPWRWVVAAALQPSDRAGPIAAYGGISGVSRRILASNILT